ncbi:DUF1294 domain-containing protein [Pseudoduganella armeniaca]|jgi:uncharacterized membrane protein YsdA (DUF1294 family)|uniref:DUF1294 domain-containing protein n=1 Tax=Pseudoduganella armeniaca TaxID=2072590 RepID=A0A2R4CA77_9BURK|nr:DUF1294 domain-containing protein [Pseudoduganella armeniaca]AVR96536.1 DUF1294 domain-containing protein [Pseudoduganella armeniaca]
MLNYYLAGAAILAALNLLTYVVYARDKAAARAGRRRTPENTLLLLGLLGGWPGALVAQRRLRHKTAKTSFQLRFWLTVIVNLGAFLLI